MDLLEKSILESGCRKSENASLYLGRKIICKNTVQQNGLLTARQTIAMRNVLRFYLTSKPHFLAEEKRTSRITISFGIILCLRKDLFMAKYVHKKRHYI